MSTPQMYLFAGHYGSGKTNIALNVAYEARAKGKKVTIVDLDIVNPYFRTKDSEAELAQKGIELISSRFANSNLDLPALPADIYRALEDREAVTILDIGGDDRGAVALGRYAPRILERGDYEMAFVVNFYRPLTRTAQEALGIMKEIEIAGGIAFTGIVHNSNLGRQTTVGDILVKAPLADQLSDMTGLPVRMTCASQSNYPELAAQRADAFGLHLQQHDFD